MNEKAAKMTERDELIRIIKGVNALNDFDNGYEEEAADKILKLIHHAKRDAWEAGCEEGLSWNPGYDDKAMAQNPYKGEWRG